MERLEEKCFRNSSIVVWMLEVIGHGHSRVGQSSCIVLQSGAGLLLLRKQNKKGLPYKNQRVKLHLHSESLTNKRMFEEKY